MKKLILFYIKIIDFINERRAFGEPDIALITVLYLLFSFAHILLACFIYDYPLFTIITLFVAWKGYDNRKLIADKYNRLKDWAHSEE